MRQVEKQKKSVEKLIEALENNNFTLASSIIASGISLNSFFKGKTPLHTAASKGQNKMVELLIKSGADVNFCNKEGMSAIHFAAQNGHISVFEALKKSPKFDINKTDNRGQTALHYSIINNHTDLAKTLINNSNCNISLKDEFGQTALHKTTQNDNYQISKELLNKDPDLKKIRDKDEKLASNYLDEKSSHQSKTLLATNQEIDNSLSRNTPKKINNYQKPPIIFIGENSPEIQNLTSNYEIECYSKYLNKLNETSKKPESFFAFLPAQNIENEKNDHSLDSNSCINKDIQCLQPESKKCSEDEISKELDRYDPSRLVYELYLSLIQNDNFRSRIILQKNIPLDSLSSARFDGNSLLHVAALHGNGEIYSKLVKLGLDPKSTNIVSHSACQIRDELYKSEKNEIKNSDKIDVEKKLNSSITTEEKQHPPTSIAPLDLFLLINKEPSLAAAA